MIGQSLNHRIVVAVSFGKISVDARVFDSLSRRGRNQCRVDDGVIQRLRAAVENKRIPLQQRIQQQGQIRIDQINSIAGHNRFVVGNRRANQGAHRINIPIVDFEEVEIADQHQAFVGIIGLPHLHQISQINDLRQSFGANASACGWPTVGTSAAVINPVQRTQMIDDDLNRESHAAGEIDRRVQSQRRTIVQGFGGRIRVGEQRSVKFLNDCIDRHTRRSPSDDSRFDQKAYVNATHVIAFDQMSRVQRIRLAVGDGISVDLRRQSLQRRKIFDFDYADNIGGFQIITNSQ